MRHELKKLLQAIFIILAVGSILLISDLSNRKKGTVAPGSKLSIAIVHWIDMPATERVQEGILDGLEGNGLVEGENFSVSVYKASSDISNLNSILKQVEAQDYSLVFVSCTPALQAAINIIKETPIVFTSVADPMLAGAGEDATRHIDNVTGCSVVCDFQTMCGLITQTAPRIKILGSVFCPGEIISVKFKDEFTQVASEHGLEVKFFPANNPSELPDAVLSMTSSNIDAVCQMGDNLMSSGISTLIKGVVNAKLPYFEFNARPLGTKMESLIQLDVDYYQNGYDAANLASQILFDKISPADIPFQVPSSVFIELNPEKAKEFGIVFSDDLTQKAKYIEGEKSQFHRKIRMAMVHYVSSPDCEDVTTGILQRLKELGHIRGDDFIFDEYNANANVITLNNIVKTVENKHYDLIFTTVLSSAQALASKITDIPILFTVVADPVGNGLGKSYADHQPNVTGIDGMSYTDKGVELLKKYLPGAKRIGVLYCPGEMASVSCLKELEKSCKKYVCFLVM